MRKLAIDGFGADQLATAKSSFAGSTKIDLQTNGQLRAELARGALYGTGLDSVAKRLAVAQATTLEELRADLVGVLNEFNLQPEIAGLNGQAIR